MRARGPERRPRAKKKDAYPGIRKKFCRFCADKTKDIDYKDVKKLEHFITERSKMVSSRSSGNCAKHQRRLSMAIKHARFIALLPYAR
jgi:small subunit ribosomal protein S18